MGSAFKSERYRNGVKQAGLVQSMGNAGLSFANQAIESFFGKIKTELLHTRLWKSYEEIDKATPSIVSASITQSDLNAGFGSMLDASVH